MCQCETYDPCLGLLYEKKNIICMRPRVRKGSTDKTRFYFKDLKNIGITHVFSCINICRVPRKLFGHKVVRPSVQTLSKGPGKS